MKAHIENIETLISLLDSFNYTEVDDDDRLVADNGFTIGYRTNELTSVHDLERYPLQVVIHVVKDGVCVYTWGCTDNEMNNQFMRWYIVKKSNVQSEAWKRQDKARDEAHAEFEALLQKQVQEA